MPRVRVRKRGARSWMERKIAAAEREKPGVGKTTSFVRECYNEMLRAKVCHRQPATRRSREFLGFRRKILPAFPRALPALRSIEPG